MKVVCGDIWTYPAQHVYVTTNLSLRKDGKAVMGRGTALQAKLRYPDIDHILGDAIKSGQLVLPLMERDGVTIGAFPVKWRWQEKASLLLIQASAGQLRSIALLHPEQVYVLPRPGCGNGGLQWEEVEPLLRHVLPDNVHIITNTRRGI